VIRRQEQAYRL